MALHGVVGPSTHVFTHAWCRGIRAAAHYWLSSVQLLNSLTYKCCASLPGLIKASKAITYPAAACFCCFFCLFNVCGRSILNLLSICPQLFVFALGGHIVSSLRLCSNTPLKYAHGARVDFPVDLVFQVCIMREMDEICRSGKNQATTDHPNHRTALVEAPFSQLK